MNDHEIDHVGIGRLPGSDDDDMATAALRGPIAHPISTGVGLVMWMLRVAPDLVAGSARLMVNPRRVRRRLRGHSRTVEVLSEALDGVISGPKGIAPLGIRDVQRLAFDRHSHRVEVGVPYGQHPGQTLDIWRSAGAPGGPTLVFIPGGGWITGTTMLQGTVLLGHLARQGWTCVAVNYRTSPAHRWPTHLHDVKRALAWVHGSIADLGGDPDRVVVAGTSAGGHLAALAGLTSSDPTWQPGFEDERTDVAAVVGIYGRYDWEGRETPERRRFMTFLEKMVVGQRQSDAPEVFAAASPIRRVGAHAPPFFVVHGRSDAIIPVAQAREFVEALRDRSASPVAYAELPGTGHGFDIVDPARAAHVARAIELFVEATTGRTAAIGS